MEWLILLVVLVAVLALVARSTTKRRTEALQRRFGPEYNRLLVAEGQRRSAEARLRERVRRREALKIRSLEPDAVAGYTYQWREAQMRFVDDPVTSVAEADGLVKQVARERGYPIDTPDEGIEMVSVDFPRLVEKYRAAAAIQKRSAQGTVSIDDLRAAFRGYRALFDELLGGTARHRRLASVAWIEGESA